MFGTTPVYSVGGEVVFGLRRDSIIADETDSILEVTKPWEDRLDNLAFELYGDPKLWWVIAELNHILDPFTEIKVGTELRIPRKERLMHLLES